MDLVKWNPMGEMRLLQERLNRLFDEPFLPAFWREDDSHLMNWRPAVDIYEEEDRIVIKAELPGVDKKDIEVDLNDRLLTLKGERSYENEVKEENYHRKERTYGKFHRSFTLPADLDPEKIKADFKDGILKIEIPKPEEQTPRKITVH